MIQSADTNILILRIANNSIHYYFIIYLTILFGVMDTRSFSCISRKILVFLFHSFFPIKVYNNYTKPKCNIYFISYLIKFSLILNNGCSRVSLYCVIKISSNMCRIANVPYCIKNNLYNLLIFYAVVISYLVDMYYIMLAYVS